MSKRWRMGSLAAVAALVLAGGFLSAAANSGKGDWPNWRGPNHNGVSAESNWSTSWPAGGPQILWRKAGVGVGFSSMAVSGGRVYTMGNIADTDYVWCLDAKTGDEIWKHTYPSPLGAKMYEGGTHSTPTVDGGRVYTFSKWGLLLCLDAAKGDVIWSVNVAKKYGAQAPTWAFASSPLILGKGVIVNAGSAGMAFDKTSGNLIWNNGAEVCGYATPVPFVSGGKPSVAIFAREELLGVAAEDGKVLWRTPWANKHLVNAADPILDGERFFISCGYDRGCAVVTVSGNKPSVVWESRAMRNHINSCVLHNGYLYGFDEIELKCLEFNTGREKWAHRGLGKGSLMLADGKLIVLSEDGRLVIAPPSPEGFQPLAEAKVLGGSGGGGSGGRRRGGGGGTRCWTTPVLAGGMIYCRSAQGELVCVDVRKK